MGDSQDDSQPSQGSVLTVMDDDRHEILYFAYGSNMSTQQMLSRCPSSTPIGLGHLKGWQWIINERGYANVVQALDAEAESHNVYGLLYLLPPVDEAKLDICEGVPHSYEKFHLDVLWARDEAGREMGTMQKVLVYVDRQRVGDGLPWAEYVVRMERGIEEMVEVWGMEKAYADWMRGVLGKGVKDQS